MLAAWLIALLVSVSPGHPGLTVEVDACLELDRAELLDTVEQQLGAGPEYRGTAAATSVDTQILLDCTTDARVELTIIDAQTSSTTTRIIDMPPASRRAEQLGWAAAASVRATWMQLVLDRGRSSTPAARRAARVARRPASPWELGDGFAVRGFFDPRAPQLMLGEQVEALHRPLRHLAWKADGELAFLPLPVEGRVEDQTQRARVVTRAISVAPVLLGWGEILGRGRGGAGTVAFYGGAGFRVGGVRMRSDVFGDSQGFRAFAGPLAAARVSVALGRFVRLAVNAEAGWLLHGPINPNGVPVSLIGPWANGVLVLVSAF
jgi:hypothetical protein